MKTTFIIITFYILCACGVKGDPVAPATPVEISRGPQTPAAVDQTAPASPRHNLHDYDDTDDSDY